MNKTLYIRDEDIPIWDRARELAGDKLSPVVVTGLKKFIAEKEAEEAESRGFHRIALTYNDSAEHNIPKTKAFIGKWLFPTTEPLELRDSDSYFSSYYSLAVTLKGNVVILAWDNDAEGNKVKQRFNVFPSLQAAAANEDANYVARRAIKELGVPVEELDI